MRRERVLYFDLLNILSCFAVVCLHCNGIVHTFSNSAAWKQSLVVETLAYFAVPVFFMLSGATLMGYRNKYDTKTFFKKRVMKTVIPFVFWSAFYIVFRLFRGELKITSAAQLIDYILNNRYEPIYWFFVPLFAAYAALPVLSLLAEDKYRKYLWYMVGMAFLTKSLIPIFTLAKISYNAFFEFPLTGNGFLMFVILGYLLSTEKEIKRKVRYVIYALGVLAVIIRYTGTYVLSMHDHTLNRAFFGYIYFTSVFLAVAVFVLFRQIKWERFFNTPIALKVIAYIASCSFGIYLIHYLVIINFKAAFGITGYGIRWRLIGPFVIYFIAFTIISILKKIPFLKHMVP